MSDTQQVLDKLHSLQLLIADELKRICEKYEIKYFMVAGTLLGAVRHKGFIPWDDDMDFGMLRCDYEYFLTVCEKELDTKRFLLQTDKHDTYYAFNFAKLQLKGTSVVESFSKDVDVTQGIYIDIFPIDSVPDNLRIKRRQFFNFWFFRNILLVKCGYGNDERKKKFSYRAARFLSIFFSIEKLKKLKYSIITKYKNETTFYVVTSDGNYGLDKETLHAEWLKDICDYIFEDRVYPGISDYESYLGYFYGNYMELPPVEKRNHHDRLEIDFGKYE